MKTLILYGTSTPDNRYADYVKVRVHPPYYVRAEVVDEPDLNDSLNLAKPRANEVVLNTVHGE